MTIETRLPDHELDRRLAALTVEHAPAPALWSGIESRLAPRRRTRPWLQGLAVAATVAGLALTAAVLAPLLDREPLPDAGRIAITAETRALQALEPSLQPASWRDDSALQRAWTDNLAAIAELEQALERSPGNRLLLDFLAEARLRQARLLGQSSEPFPNPNPTERRIDT